MTDDDLNVGQPKFGFVAVIGEPNAGKSTLINHMVGGKVSIVSPKVQTTRTRTLGIMCHGPAQISFIDTPGIFAPSKKNKMERAIVASAYEGMTEADLLLLLVDVSKKSQKSLEPILEKLKENYQGKVSLVLNKVDKIPRDQLLALSKELNDAFSFEATFMISALKGNGINELLDYLADAMPKGIWHYPEDQMTDMPMRLMAAEITREKLFYQLKQEIPYQLTVETDGWEPFKDGSLKISQTVYVGREAHKKIVLGSGGSFIKKIGQQARHELEDIMDGRVHLKLFVKVRENWMDDDEHFKIWGLDSKA